MDEPRELGLVVAPRCSGNSSFRSLSLKSIKCLEQCSALIITANRCSLLLARHVCKAHLILQEPVFLQFTGKALRSTERSSNLY
jgi:hypothetical protein